MLYIWRHKFMRSVQLAAFFVFMVFTSISSGPMLSVLLQLAMTLWDRFFFFLRGKWFVLVGGAALALLVFYFASQFHLLDFVIQNLMFNPQTATPRLIILEYGSAEVLRHPIFGIGLGEWVRPWYKKHSVDNFWLNYAMRFGLPSLLLLVAALAISCSRIAMQSTLTPRERDYRTGYLITLTGIVITLGTVYIWGATSILVWIYIGAGAMFYMKADEPVADSTVRARRAAQARGFDVAPGRAFATATGPASPRRAAGRGRAAPASAAPRTASGSRVSRVTGRPGDDRHV